MATEKRERLIKTVIDNEAQRIVFTVAGAGELVLDVSALSADIRDYAAYHGLKQKVADAAAMPKSDNATPAMKLAAMQQVADQLANGDWSVRGNGDGEGKAPAGIRFNAYALFVERTAASRGISAPSRDVIRARWDGWDKKQQIAVAAQPDIAAIINELRAAKSPAINADALLGDLL
jgi:hypothetical protein